MVSPNFQIYQCLNPACHFRFPVHALSQAPARCPRCRHAVTLVEPSFPSQPVETISTHTPGPQIDIFLDNIRSAWNVGSMFRSADGAGIRHMYLCGITPTPENPKISKTALGSEFAVPWSYNPDGLSLIDELKVQKKAIWALEGGPRSVSIFEPVPTPTPREITLVIGNEVTGVDPAILQACDRVVSIPMLGYKRSLNVAIAFGIAVYILRFTCPTK